MGFQPFFLPWQTITSVQMVESHESQPRMPLMLLRQPLAQPWFHVPPRPSISRWSSPPGMTRRPARDVSLSPRRRSPSSPARRSSRGLPLAPGGCPLIATATPPAPGPLLPVLVWDPGHDPAAHAPCLPTGIVLHVLMRRINTCSGYVTCPQFLSRRMTQTMIRIHQQMIPECQTVRKLFADLVNPPSLSHCADPFPNTDMKTLRKASSPGIYHMSLWQNTLFICTQKTNKWTPSKYTGLP